MFTRHELNPIITPQNVRPSRPDFEVIGAFNAGVAACAGEVILVLRVAERPLQIDSRRIFYPEMTDDGLLVVRNIAREDPRFDLSDARLIHDQVSGATMLSSISHLRLARSQDGVHFRVEEHPWLVGQPPYENFGVEDARVTRIGDVYYVNYSAVSTLGIATALISTPDFVHIERHGIILPPSNRDVTLFPEQIGGRYVCYHRPMPGQLGGMNIWLATSSDLLDWGHHRLVLSAQPGGWEAGRVGGGAPPLLTPAGWLSIYHAADPGDRYCLGAFLTSLDEPGRVIARSLTPLLAPQASYETQGFFPNVVFTCGALLHEGVVRLYYGASDETIALADVPLENILTSLH